jgi:hypothetical protein
MIFNYSYHYYKEQEKNLPPEIWLFTATHFMSAGHGFSCPPVDIILPQTAQNTIMLVAALFPYGMLAILTEDTYFLFYSSTKYFERTKTQ